MQKIALKEGYVPSVNEEYMNPMHLEYFRNKLETWKAQLLEESRETLTHLKDDTVWNEPDLTDRASIEAEITTELRSRSRYFKLIDKIDDALKRIDTGEYGYCKATGEEIGLKRLDARPITTLCIEAQKEYERYERQHSDDNDVKIIHSDSHVI